MRIARVLMRSSARPRVALERDGVLYDVETLERELGAAVPIHGDPWDFHGRVVSLSCAGLGELDRKLLQSQRPVNARFDGDEDGGFAWLAPFDSDRATYVHVEGAACRVGHAPSALGQDALVDVLPDAEERPEAEVSIGVVLGEDLFRASAAEAKHGMLGLTIVIDWCSANGQRGLRPQVGPVVMPMAALGNPRALRVSAVIGPGSMTLGGSAGSRNLDMGTVADLGRPLEEAVAVASSVVPLRAGDLVGVGPLPRGACRAHGIALGLHERVAVKVDRIGELRGVAVARSR